jgi:hypothetical protein
MQQAAAQQSMIVNQRRELGKFVRTGALAVLFLVVLTILFEVGLRAFAPEFGTFSRFDPTLGFSYIPGAPYKFDSPESCGWSTTGTINNLGLRDDDFPAAKPAGEFRILALGNSYTVAYQFPLHDTWSQQVEQRLNENPVDGLHYQVVNAGRSGASTTEQYLYYTGQGETLAPDVVLVLFFPRDYFTSADVSRVRAYAKLGDDGALVIDTSFSEKRSRVSEIVDLAQSYSYAASYFTRLLTLLNRTGGDANAAEGEAVTTPLNADTPEVVVTQRVLLALQQAVEADGARLVIVHGSTPSQVNWDQLDESGSSPDDQSRQLMADFTAAHNIPYLDLVPTLRAYSAANHVLIHGCAGNNGQGHWQPQTQTLVANTVYGFLEANGLAG